MLSLIAEVAIARENFIAATARANNLSQTKLFHLLLR